MNPHRAQSVAVWPAMHKVGLHVVLPSGGKTTFELDLDQTITLIRDLSAALITARDGTRTQHPPAWAPSPYPEGPPAICSTCGGRFLAGDAGVMESGILTHDRPSCRR